MNNPKSYADHNKLQRRDNILCLEEYVKKIRWRKNKDLTVVDIGSGDGSFTSNILQKYLPDNFKELIGVDISEEMVRFATEHYVSQGITFRNLDIGGTLPEEFRNHFDHAFSFYTLHWVINQKKAFSNIYNLLAPGGCMLVTIIGYKPAFFEVFRALSRSDKWGHWIGDVESRVSPYHDFQEPETKIQNLLEEIGFTGVEVNCKKMSYCYDGEEDLKKFIRAITVFKIPEEALEDYINDVIKQARNMGYLDENYKIFYHCIVVYAEKSC